MLIVTPAFGKHPYWVIDSPVKETFMLRPSQLVSEKPAVASTWRREAPRCAYDHVAQVRHWSQSDEMRKTLASTGAPNSSTKFDGEADE